MQEVCQTCVTATEHARVPSGAQPISGEIPSRLLSSAAAGVIHHDEVIPLLPLLGGQATVRCIKSEEQGAAAPCPSTVAGRCAKGVARCGHTEGPRTRLLFVPWCRGRHIRSRGTARRTSSLELYRPATCATHDCWHGAVRTRGTEGGLDVRSCCPTRTRVPFPFGEVEGTPLPDAFVYSGGSGVGACEPRGSRVLSDCSVPPVRPAADGDAVAHLESTTSISSTSVAMDKQMSMHGDGKLRLAFAKTVCARETPPRSSRSSTEHRSRQTFSSRSWTLSAARPKPGKIRAYPFLKVPRNPYLMLRRSPRAGSFSGEMIWKRLVCEFGSDVKAAIVAMGHVECKNESGSNSDESACPKYLR